MAKTLKQILDGVKSSKIKNKDILGTKPGVDYSPKAGDERKFADKHEIEKHADRVGNGDDIYQGTNVKYSMDTSQMKNFGHSKDEDEKVYEETKCNMSEAGTMCEVHGMKKCPSMKEEAKCNMTKEGTECPVHGMAECWSAKPIKEKPVREEKLNELLVQNYVSGTKNKRAEVHKLSDGSFEVKKYNSAHGGSPVSSTKHDMSDSAHDIAKKHLGEDVEQIEEKAIARGKQTVLVTMKSDPHSRSGGATKRIKKSEYDPKLHNLAEEDIDEGLMKTIKRGLQGWSNAEHPLTGSANKPKDVVARTRAMDSASLKKLAGRTDVAKHSPAHLQSKVAQRELRQRNEETEIDERKLTPGETKKREEVVMSLKKKLGDFRKRYGKDRGKSVMYATATKVAKGMKEDLAQPLIGSATQPRGNSDEAADMVKTELRALANKAMHLVMNMPEGMHVEPWVQAKIAQAKEMVSSVHDYMIYGDHKEEDEQAPAVTPMTFPNYNVDPGATGIGQNI
jgi:hypothetical protein